MATNFFIYLLAGAALVPLSLGIHERLGPSSPAAMKVATAFGLMWATVVVGSGMIFNIGGGSEMIGAIWVLLATLVAMRFKLLPSGLNYLGLLIAGAGFLTILPALSVFQDVFGLSQIPWFIWLGVVQITRGREVASNEVMTRLA